MFYNPFAPEFTIQLIECNLFCTQSVINNILSNRLLLSKAVVLNLLLPSVISCVTRKGQSVN